MKLTVSYLKQKTELDGIPLQTSSSAYVQTVLQAAPEDSRRGQTGSTADSDIEIANAVLEYGLGWGNLLATYSYTTSEAAPVWAFTSLGNTNPTSAGASGNQTARSGEIRLTTNLEGRWNFLGGLYAENVDENFWYDYWWHGSAATNPYRLSPLYVGNFLGAENYWRTLKQKAAFAEASWKILPRLTLTGGMRYYDYERWEQTHNYGPLPGITDLVRSADATGTVFRGNLSYKISDDALVYAGWSQGFRFGKPQAGVFASQCDQNGDGIVDGTNITIASTTKTTDDSVDNYELGTKFSALDRRLTVSAAVYRIDWSNLPSRFETPPSCVGGATGVYTVNAGNARSEGVEVQANFYVTRAFRVDLTGSSMRARLVDNGAPLDLNVPREAHLLAPETNGSLGLQYEFRIAGSPTFVRADTTYVGSTFGNIQNTRNTETGSYVTVDTSAGIDIGSVDVNLYVRNLLNADDYTYLGRQQAPYAAYPGYGYRLRPRTVGLQLSYSF